MIYLTSDTHFCHDREYIYQARGFSSIEEHDENIVKNWNSVVNPDDEVYLLGDVVLMNTEYGLRYLQQLKHLHIPSYCSPRYVLYNTLREKFVK